MKFPQDNYNYLHFKHQPREVVGGVPRPDLSGLHLYVPYITTRELWLYGVVFGDAGTETCGWGSHLYKEPLYLKHGYYYSLKQYFDDPYSDYWGAIQSAHNYMTKYPREEYGEKHVNWLSTFDTQGVPPATYEELVFRGNEADLLEHLLVTRVFNEPFVGEILSEKVKLTLSTYAEDLTKYHCVLEFHLGERYEEVIFTISDAMCKLLNWSYDWELTHTFIRSGGSDPAKENEPSWNLKRALFMGEGYVLTLRAPHGASRRVVKVDMGSRKPASFYPPPDLIDNTILNTGLHSGRIVRGVDPPLHPAGLRLIRVADQSKDYL